MCGIVGIWTKDHSSREGAIKGMVNTILHRGPDHHSDTSKGAVSLGHTRLSIIDTSSDSNQPMADESGNYLITFNGEIYNFKDLRNDLEKNHGMQFRTSGDTEVLLKGLIAEGVNFLKKVNGFFAFGFYNHQKEELLLARDRFGIKPLFYAEEAGAFLFGSSLESVSSQLKTKSLDRHSLAKYIQHSYVPAPDTMLKEVKKLLPGHFLKVDESGVEAKKYYELPEVDGGNTKSLEASFEELLRKSVRRRLVSDVPVGTFLSGGYDSSVISMIARDEQPEIPAFSIGFPQHPYYDESQKAARIAKHLGLEHHIIPVDSKLLDDALPEVLDAIDEPFADSSAVLVNILSKYTRKSVKVALSGDGADELMGGYNKHRALLQSVETGFVNQSLKAISPVLQSVPESRNSAILDKLRKVKRYSHGLKMDFPERYEAWASFTPKTLVSELLIDYPSTNGLSYGLVETDFNTVLKADMDLVLANDMLPKVDLMSMYQGLEVRVPFLDHELVEFLFKLPAEKKMTKSAGKILLKKAFENRFPEGFFEGKKRGFEAPLTHWLQGPLEGLRSKYLSESFIKSQGIFNYKVVQSLERKAIGPIPGDAPHTIWAILVFQTWYEKNFTPSREV